MDKVKRIFLWLVVIFILYSIFTAPQQAADLVGSTWDILKSGVENLAAFFNALLSR